MSSGCRAVRSPLARPASSERLTIAPTNRPATPRTRSSSLAEAMPGAQAVARVEGDPIVSELCLAEFRMFSAVWRSVCAVSTADKYGCCVSGVSRVDVVGVIALRLGPSLTFLVNLDLQDG